MIFPRGHDHTPFPTPPQQVHRYYRQSGGSINRATEEAVSGAAKNKAVRGAVKSGVAAGVKASM